MLLYCTTTSRARGRYHPFGQMPGKLSARPELHPMAGFDPGVQAAAAYHINQCAAGPLISHG